MRTFSRRQFIGSSAAGLTAAAYVSAGAAELGADPIGLPIGCQVFPVREQLGRDFEGTLRELAAAGYRVIEFCSPPSFVDMGFAPFVGMKASEIKGKIAEAGLRVVSCHYQFTELKEHLNERIEFAKELGLKQMIVATLAIPRDGTMDDWRRAVGEMNGLGERTRKAGIQLGFHNHDFEFRKIGGVLVFDELMSRFDKKLVKSQFQVSVVSLGFDPAVYIAKYPGQFVSLHLQDWSASEKKQVAIGQGAIDWKKLFTAAKGSGVQNYFVEMSMDLLKASSPYLHKLEV